MEPRPHRGGSELGFGWVAAPSRGPACLESWVVFFPTERFRNDRTAKKPLPNDGQALVRRYGSLLAAWREVGARPGPVWAGRRDGLCMFHPVRMRRTVRDGFGKRNWWIGAPKEEHTWRNGSGAHLCLRDSRSKSWRFPASSTWKNQVATWFCTSHQPRT